MPELLAAIGAVLSAVASVLSAIWFVKQERKACDRRLETFKEGIRFGREND